ncbi:hypothetical protein F511_26041 [Dorcoceras hygrometricum]|uniref:Uncharacterized protein n=1 Tax=Dorcoceras hygrometricum TaxID=472368 RepID=A0A2Z7CIB0_9LAMI|nr:hypothetical protein F511_26041 [Dorcoceras hygrometricum]
MERITYPEAHPDLENYRIESQRHTNLRNNTHEILGKPTETHGRELQLNQLIILPQQPNMKIKPKLGLVLIEIGTPKECSATDLAQNGDGKRRQSANENHGEQCLGFEKRNESREDNSLTTAYNAPKLFDKLSDHGAPIYNSLHSHTSIQLSQPTGLPLICSNTLEQHDHSTARVSAHPSSNPEQLAPTA